MTSSTAVRAVRLSAPVMAHLRSVWQYRGLIGNFAQRELKSKYKGSLFGWLWSLLNPAATLLIYTLVFSFFLRIPPPVAGNGHTKTFALYLFTALIGWNFFYAVLTGSMGSLVAVGPLLRKIYFPPFAPVVGSALATLTQTLIEAGIAVAFYVVVDNVGWTFLLLPVIVVLLAGFALGLGLALSVLNVRYRDVSYLVTIALNFLFYATPIIYPLSLVPTTWHGWLPMRQIYSLNPLVQYVEALRDVLYQLRTPSLGRFVAMTAVSVVTFTLGWLFFQRAARDVAEEL